MPAAPIALALLLIAAPARLLNARVETRSVASGLEIEMRKLLATRSGPLWIGYAVAANRPQRSCCWSSVDEIGRGCGGCRLEVGKGEAFLPARTAEPVPLEGSSLVRVLLRAEAGRIGRVRLLSEDCWLDAGDLPFVWLEGVRPDQSVAYLATLADEREGSTLAAIAAHADPAADEVLERFLAAEEPRERRRQAAFWVAQSRGQRGYATLARLVREDPDPRFREHLVFALTQSHEPGAVETIIEVARSDRSPQVRGQALFWLAQTAARRAPRAIEAALDSDPEVEVKKKAVFALSQLPKDEGVPLLIKVASTHRQLEVRKQAMFWLGQSGDSRALAFFEGILKR